jgi:CheY-like chemotaxis protein
MSVILVVDDEPLQRDILKTILDDEGYETSVFREPQTIGNSILMLS